MIDNLREALVCVVRMLYGIDVKVELVVAPENTGADYATNLAMQLAKLVHKPPMVIAEEIKAKFDKLICEAVPEEALGGKELDVEAGARQIFEVSVAQPGFLNFRVGDAELAETVSRIASGDLQVAARDYFEKTVVCEFSDPNPFKVLHVGHLYTSIVGDSIARLLECAGAKVVRANFGGDVGLHVGKTLWELKQEGQEKPTIEDIAKAYVKGTRAYEDDEKAHQEIVKTNAEIYDIALHDRHDSELAKLYWYGRELSYQYFKDFYAQIGVHFDKFYPESTVASRGLEEVRIGLDRGVYDESDGAVVYRGEKLGLHTRVFINREGLPTYEAKDVGLIFTKWDDWHFDESVVITGHDSVAYMKVVLASVSEMDPKLSERTRHLTHGQVRLAGNKKMASRKGNFLKAIDVLEVVKVELAKVTEQADPKVVLAAIKYAFLKYRLGGDIIFDPKESVAMAGNSGVYLLYAVVRAKKILQKSGADTSSVASQKIDGDVGYAPSVAQDGEKVNPHSEDGDCFGRRLEKAGASSAFCSSSTQFNSYTRKLAMKVARYEENLAEAIEEKSPSKLCTYLYELAQEFSRFYEHVKVSGSEQEQELRKLVEAYVRVMEHGLGLLGIEIPEEM